MIQFVKSPVGQFYLAYAIGETASLSGELEKELIDKGYAVEISEKANEGDSRRLQSDDSQSGGSEAVPVVDIGRDGSGQHHNKSDKRRRTRN